ncbi:MAG: cation:proton antiporter [Candidatus Izimaplasma sp.]|nr:cation:proton antiporter [Candidatus Izimaplasma bacterium]
MVLADALQFTHFFDKIGGDLFFNIAILLILGMIGGKIAGRFNLPHVTGYIIIGMLFGPGGISVINEEVLYNFKVFKVLALGFIGFNIGLELDFTSLKNYGKKIVFITVVQALITFALVFTVIYFVVSKHQITYALIFGAIATVTTPAPIVAFLKNYKAKGPIAKYVVGIVALDDIIGIILFSLVLPIGVFLAGHEAEVITISNLVIGPLFDIGFSVLIGGAIGLTLVRALNLHEKDDNISVILILIIGLFFGIGVGHAAETSAILLPLVIGMTVRNTSHTLVSTRIKSIAEAMTLPLLLLFFTLSGAELDLRTVQTIGIAGIIYIVVRVIGKVAGTYFGASIIKEEKPVRKFLGFTLIPQGGVSIDMAILAEVRFVQIATQTGNSEFAQIGSTILTVILGAVIFYKIIGEIVVKWAFDRAGEIPYDELEKIRHDW